MQAGKFHDGSYYGHKIELHGYKGHFSAWYDKEGKLTAAEQFVNNRERDVKVGGDAWEGLAARSGAVKAAANA